MKRITSGLPTTWTLRNISAFVGTNWSGELKTSAPTIEKWN
jgi:hypothetical protein